MTGKESAPQQVPDDAQQQAWLDRHHLEYHERQFQTLYRSTAQLVEFARRHAPSPERVLDVGCGACATLFHLANAIGGQWTGVDCSAEVLDLARRLLTDHHMSPMPELVCGDMFRLPEFLPKRSFDAAVSCQTLSWLPRHEQALAALLAMVKPGGVAIVTSLFTDCLVDARIEILEYPGGDFTAPRGPAYYNIYSLERFRQQCLSLGATEVVARDFQMDVDLPAPSHGLMGTYTRRMEDGDRLQFSGPLVLPWKFVAVHM